MRRQQTTFDLSHGQRSVLPRASGLIPEVCMGITFCRPTNAFFVPLCCSQPFASVFPWFLQAYKQHWFNALAMMQHWLGMGDYQTAGVIASLLVQMMVRAAATAACHAATCDHILFRSRMGIGMQDPQGSLNRDRTA
jgi:hypothetical protein